MRFPALPFALICASPLSAQEVPNTILVMDGSGSMWGQIDGTAKISIAQDVVGDLLGSIPAEQGLGLTVYGHRKRGDCSDIETIVPPAPGTAEAVRSAVKGIKPLGKTPMTDAVIAAAEALRYTEDKATVILVSDGVETCNPDPCAAARLLEEAGIDFTAHVIGFDVGSDPQALAQMRCIAEETGGRFLTADDAGQLSKALTEVAQAPAPVIADVTFEARLDSAEGPLVEGPVFWSLAPEQDGFENETQGNGLTVALEKGSYEATAYWAAQEVAQTRQFVTAAAPRSVVVVFEAPALTAVVTAPESAPVGSQIEVTWEGPEAEGDVIGLTRADTEDPNYIYRFETTQEVAKGKPATLLMPTTPGAYVVEYSLGADSTRIGATPITLTPVTAEITAPARVEAGKTFEASWVGPDYKNDFLAITKADVEDPNHVYRFSSAHVATAGGPTLRLQAPTEPGAYVIEYAFGQDSRGLVSVPLEVTAASASITAPAAAPAGSVIEVAWEGPNNKNDGIGITPADAEDPNYYHRFATSPVGVDAGPTLKVQLPTTPGDYVVEYYNGLDRSRLHAVPITVTPVTATITAPQSAPAGSVIEVAWDGPGYKNDGIGITPADAEDPNYYHRFATSPVGVDAGPALKVQLPTTPGEYVVEYYNGLDRSRLHAVPITVAPVSASITAPASGAAGSTIEVSWDGPGYPRDYIGITPADAEDPNHPYRFASTKQQVKAGAVLTLTLPDTPGEYVIEYAFGVDHKRLAAVPIVVE